MTTAIILAAGKSERMGGDVDKAFLSLGAKPVVVWSLLAFEHCVDIDAIVLVVRKNQLDASKAVAKMFGISKLKKIVAGGARRQDSVAAALKACDADTRYVVIHDGARPMITSETISETVKMVKRTPAVTLGRPVTDTLKQCDKGITVTKTMPRDRIWAVQTPQAFQFGTISKAYASLGKNEITDDCAAVEAIGVAVKIITSYKPNFKITTPDDLQLVSALMK